MLKISFLRNILLISLFFALAFPLYDFLYLIPAYQSLMIKEVESDAIRFVRSLVISNHLEQFELEKETIPPALIEMVNVLRSEQMILKLRVFSPSGEIIYSSESKEIGTVNNKDYFVKIVAKGRTYSKMIKRKTVTAEGVQIDTDQIETYVPLVFDGHFHGAMEVYYDVSAGQNSLRSLSYKSFFTLLFVALGLLCTTLLVLSRAYDNYMARERAEALLKEANEVLEDRVRQRTEELSRANQTLSAEITERRKAQQAQKSAFEQALEARNRIDAIISSVADAILVTDQQDRLVLINPAAETLFGVRAKEVVGAHLPEVIGFDSLLLQISKARVQLKEKGLAEFDFSMQVEGQERVYQGRTSRLLDASAALSRGLVLLIHDVTRERQIDRMKSEFVSMAAHELQTPLTMVLGYSELLLDPSKDFAPEEQKDFLHIVNDKAIELSRLVDDILDLSRIEEGKGLKLTFRPLSLGQICQRLVTRFERDHRQHRFLLDLPPQEPTIEADGVRLMQVVENLLSNAVKYSPDGGLIRVVVHPREDRLQLDVIDQGIGMREEEKNRAFERFYRADASNTAIRGVGLGLSISRYIVNAHRGDIHIFSSKGQGTRVEVSLPLTQPKTD
jgi:PAS domain S-box-containing protein